MIHRKIQFSVATMLRMTPLGAAIVLIGCGGAGGSSSSGTSAGTTANLGQAQVKYFGTPKPLSVGTANQITYTAQAGATYTSFAITPTPNLASTNLAFSRSLASNGTEIFTVPASGSTAPSVLTHASASAFPSYTQGGVIAFLTVVNNNYSVDSILGDGSQLKTLIANKYVIPTISPNGQTIAYVDPSTGNIYTVPVAGGTTYNLYTGGLASSRPVVWSPNSLDIAFAAGNSNTGTANVYTIVATGSVPSNVTPVSQQTGNSAVTAWSPDSQSLACTYAPSGGTATSTEIVSLSGGENLNLTPSTFSDSSPCFSPDNTKIAYYRNSTGSAVPGIYESDFAGTNPQLIVPDPSGSGTTGPVENIVWSPFQERVLYIGSGGTLSAGPIAGFLMNQNGGQFASLMTFAATTPSTAKITPPPPATGNGALIFQLGADAITNVTFTNTYNGSHTSLNFTTTPTIIISVDGTTGFVEFVAAGTYGKKVATPSRSAGTTTTYNGRFTAIYDATGKNLAPSGATTLEVDSTTGKLISFR